MNFIQFLHKHSSSFREKNEITSALSGRTGKEAVPLTADKKTLRQRTLSRNEGKGDTRKLP